MKLKLLDLYSCAGIGAIGYHQAGFEVVGVDINPQPRYPFKHIQANALDILNDAKFCRKFDFIHASPPCQRYSKSTGMFRASGKWYPDLVQPTRDALERIGVPYVIENVPGAPVRPDIVLHGWMFGLKVMRKRIFEMGGWWMMQPGITKRVGSVKEGDFCTIIGKQGYRKYKGLPKNWRPKFDHGTGIKTWAFAMGIPPTFGPFKDVEISESIPPAYTRFIGETFLLQTKK